MHPDAKIGAAVPVDEVENSVDARRIGLLDVLTENTDRNPGNWFTTSDGQVIPIDQGAGWSPARDRDYPTGGDVAHWPTGFAEAYTAKVGPGYVPGAAYDPSHYEAKWIDNDLSPGYVRSLRSKLLDLRAEFERLGRTDWHDRMMTRLDIVASHAKGTVSL